MMEKNPYTAFVESAEDSVDAATYLKLRRIFDALAYVPYDYLCSCGVQPEDVAGIVATLSDGDPVLLAALKKWGACTARTPKQWQDAYKKIWTTQTDMDTAFKRMDDAYENWRLAFVFS